MDKTTNVYILLIETEFISADGRHLNFNDATAFRSRDRAEYIMDFDISLAYEDKKNSFGDDVEGWKKWVDERRNEDGWRAVTEDREGNVRIQRYFISEQELG